MYINLHTHSISTYVILVDNLYIEFKNTQKQCVSMKNLPF
jgi:hypothetical protein